MLDTHVLNRDAKGGCSPVDQLQPKGSVGGADKIDITPK
jgi:hypothetical protein